MAIKTLDVYPCSPIYIRYKKHLCPVCNRELEARYDSKIVEQKSLEGRKKDFSVCHTHFIADIEERTWYLYCPKCEAKIPFGELKKHEKSLKKSKILKIFKRR